MWQLGIVQLSDSFLLLYLRRDRVWNLTWDQKWSPLSAAEEPEDPPWWWRGGAEREDVRKKKWAGWSSSLEHVWSRCVWSRGRAWTSRTERPWWRLVEVKGQFEDIWSRTSTPEALWFLKPLAVMIHWAVWSLANVVQREVSPVGSARWAVQIPDKQRPSFLMFSPQTLPETLELWALYTVKLQNHQENVVGL